MSDTIHTVRQPEPAARAFEVVACGELSTVIDAELGHEVCLPRPGAEASAFAQDLNRAAARPGDTLALLLVNA